MCNEIVKVQNKIILSEKDINDLTMSGIIPSDTPVAQVTIFARVCEERGLSPFSRQIYLIKRYTKKGDRFIPQTGIDGYRSLAARSGLYAGSDDYLYDEGLTVFQMINANRPQPITATATVWKIIAGMRVPFVASVSWKDYIPGDNQDFMWKSKPFMMLGKVAEATALRKGFPENVGGIYIDEEMQKYDAEVVDLYTPEVKERKDKIAEAMKNGQVKKIDNPVVAESKENILLLNDLEDFYWYYSALPDRQLQDDDKIEIWNALIKQANAKGFTFDKETKTFVEKT
jgi:phage recombination protein Bet